MSIRSGEGLRGAGLLTVLTVAVLRCATSFSPQVWFDVDPSFDPTRLPGLGPAGSLWLDVVLWLGCALVLGGEWLTKRGLEGKLLVLALLPLPVVLYHGWDDGGDLWRGSTWAAGAMAAVAVAHLVRDSRMRPMVLGALLAVCVPLLVRGVMQMTVEHEATVVEFEQYREDFFTQRGWEADSPQAKIYERRLRQPQPRGWFDTANIFASVMAFSFVAFLGLAWESVRRKLPGGYAGLAGLLAAGMAAGLVMTGSKGAILAAGVGVALFLLLQGKRFKPSGVGFVLPGLMGFTILGVMVRGLLPEGFLGDKSLLFRWHYLISSKGIFLDHPELGVGPDGYQQAYMLHRLPRNPEEVTSAHSMFVDWICSLGVAGLAWVGLIVLLAWRSGRRIHQSGSDERDHSLSSRSWRWIAPSFIGMVGLGLAMATEWPVLYGQDIFIRLVGLGGFILVAGVLIRMLESMLDTGVVAVFWCAIAAVLVHSQIEMTIHQPGAVVWAMCAVGAIGRARPPQTERNEGLPRRGMGVIAILICLISAGWITVRGALPAWKQEQLMAEAAALLAQKDTQTNKINDEIDRHLKASGRLLLAYEAWLIEVRPLEEAARQTLRAAAISLRAEKFGLLSEAIIQTQRAVEIQGKSSSIALLSRLYEQSGLARSRRDHLDLAIDLAIELAQHDPHGIHPWVRLGDLYWIVGRITDAKVAYRNALDHNQNLELDPLKQLPERESTRLEKRLTEYALNRREE